MRRLFLTIAAVAATLASLSAAGEAVARDHGGRWEHGGGRGGQPGWARGAPQGWSRGPGPGPGQGPGPGPGAGRWERAPLPPEAYGPPPGAYGVRRGGYLPPEMRGGVVQDYRRYRLRPPPPGYGWVRSGRSLMLMDMGTGQVFDVIPD